MNMTRSMPRDRFLVKERVRIPSYRQIACADEVARVLRPKKAGSRTASPGRHRRDRPEARPPLARRHLDAWRTAHAAGGLPATHGNHPGRLPRGLNGPINSEVGVQIARGHFVLATGGQGLT